MVRNLTPYNEYQEELGDFLERGISYLSQAGAAPSPENCSNIVNSAPVVSST